MRNKIKGRNVKTTKIHNRKKYTKDKINQKDMAGILGIMSQAI